MTYVHPYFKVIADLYYVPCDTPT